jgi:hypothetical protein
VVGRPAPAAAATLSVAPAAACLDAAELTALVERELDTPVGAAVPMRFEVSGTQRARGYDARLDVFDERGRSARRRMVEAADCATLQEVVAVAMTLALSDAAGTLKPAAVPNGPEEPNVSSAPPQASLHDASPREASAEIATTHDRDAWVPSLSGGLLVDAGTLPSASLGASVDAALGVGRIQLQALFEREVDVGGASSPDAAAILGFVGAGLLACTPLAEQGTWEGRSEIVPRAGRG